MTETRKYTRGWIRMQVLSGIVDIGRFASGIANSDTELERGTVLLLMELFSNRLGKKLEWKFEDSVQHSINVNAVVNYLEVALNSPQKTPQQKEETDEEPPNQPVLTLPLGRVLC